MGVNLQPQRAQTPGPGTTLPCPACVDGVTGDAGEISEAVGAHWTAPPHSPQPDGEGRRAAWTWGTAGGEVPGARAGPSAVSLERPARGKASGPTPPRP